MPVTNWINYSVRLLMVLLVITATSTPIKSQMKPRRLDDTTGPPPPDSEVKCGSCSTCKNPCYQSPPPPSPPPPSFPYCPPPPPPAGYVYIPSPQRGLNPIVTCNSGSSLNLAAVLIGFGLVGLVVFLIFLGGRFKILIRWWK
ncbi:Homeobox protein like [Actinidia chinensis var. chinensis]|uniref:Homeobox protein like n=1 Tax=Actinidia chinensis var. chinensis TaxID=1590841 RepID=A0A2R6P1D9_ACTCC|nr:Homeobox protein like [Actinidia chinensis var. chinensis]